MSYIYDNIYRLVWVHKTDNIIIIFALYNTIEMIYLNSIIFFQSLSSTVLSLTSNNRKFSEPRTRASSKAIRAFNNFVGVQ